MIRLPYRKSLNWYLMAFSGVYLFGEMIRSFSVFRPALADWLWKLHAGLLLFSFCSLSPAFAFRPEGKVAPDKAWLRINILEFYIWCVAGCAGLFFWTGLLSYTEGYEPGIWYTLRAGLVLFPLLLALNSRKILFRDDLIPYEVAEELAARKTDPGPFQYREEGFTYSGKPAFQCLWADIEVILGYKTDSYTYDTVRLILKKTDGAEWRVHEDMAGWFIFIEQLEAHLKGINTLWQMEVIAQPFATNATLVYEKGRNLMQDWQKGPEGEGATPAKF